MQQKRQATQQNKKMPTTRAYAALPATTAIAHLGRVTWQSIPCRCQQSRTFCRQPALLALEKAQSLDCVCIHAASATVPSIFVPVLKQAHLYNRQPRARVLVWQLPASLRSLTTSVISLVAEATATGHLEPVYWRRSRKLWRRLPRAVIIFLTSPPLILPS